MAKAQIALRGLKTSYHENVSSLADALSSYVSLAYPGSSSAIGVAATRSSVDADHENTIDAVYERHFRGYQDASHCFCVRLVFDRANQRSFRNPHWPKKFPSWEALRRKSP